MRDCGLHIAAKTVCFPEVRVKSKTSEHIVIFGNKNSRSLKHETGVWTTDLGFPRTSGTTKRKYAANSVTPEHIALFAERNRR